LVLWFDHLDHRSAKAIMNAGAITKPVAVKIIDWQRYWLARKKNALRHFLWLKSGYYGFPVFVRLRTYSVNSVSSVVENVVKSLVTTKCYGLPPQRHRAHGELTEDFMIDYPLDTARNQKGVVPPIASTISRGCKRSMWRTPGNIAKSYLLFEISLVSNCCGIISIE